jgi:hypothetical protein
MLFERVSDTLGMELFVLLWWSGAEWSGVVIEVRGLVVSALVLVHTPESIILIIWMVF